MVPHRRATEAAVDGVHGSVYDAAVKAKRPLAWDARSVRGLRRHLDLTQAQLAEELGVRQQTVSEWETGQYAPRGASERLLTIVAERGGYYRSRA
jgi:DNA-binding transcriptional regulator YiaG